MTNHRLNHKTYLQQYLQTLLFNSLPLPVFTTRNNNITQYPYIVVSSGNLTPNRGNQSLTDTGTYTRGYGYSIFIIQKPSDSNAQADIVENNFDEVESLIIDLFQSRTVRDCVGKSNQWQDLQILGQVTSPYSDQNINLDGISIVKRFDVQIQQVEDF